MDFNFAQLLGLGEALSNASAGAQAGQILAVNHQQHHAGGLSEMDANMAAAMADAGVSLVDIPVTTNATLTHATQAFVQGEH